MVAMLLIAWILAAMVVVAFIAAANVKEDMDDYDFYEREKMKEKELGNDAVKKCIAIRFDKETYDYILKIATEQNRSFSFITASMLKAIREDDERIENEKE